MLSSIAPTEREITVNLYTSDGTGKNNYMHCIRCNYRNTYMQPISLITSVFHLLKLSLLDLPMAQ